MSRIQMMFRGWTSPDGVQMFPGMVDRDSYPEIPEDHFWSTPMTASERLDDFVRRSAESQAKWAEEQLKFGPLQRAVEARVETERERLKSLVLTFCRGRMPGRQFDQLAQLFEAPHV